MATKKSERIGAIVVMIVLLIGAFGSYIAMALSVDNSPTSSSDTVAQYEEYIKQQKEQQEQNAANSEALVGYSTRQFDENIVSSLAIEVIVDGDGEVISETDNISVSYFGWTSDGKIFDSSKKKNAEDLPISFSLNGVIEGWTKGISGQRVGSIIRLTIPSSQAYGSSGNGIIPPDAPLEFIVQIHSINKE